MCIYYIKVFILHLHGLVIPRREFKAFIILHVSACKRVNYQLLLFYSIVHV